MNVGIVCPYDWTVPGGVANHIGSLAGELRRLGHHVDVLAPAERPLDEPGLVGLGGSLPVPYNGSVARIAFGPRAALRVRRAVARGGYDLLHVHEPLSPSVGLLAVAQAKVPVVGTFHASLDRSLALRATSPLLRRAFNRLAARIAVSPSARDTWQRYFGGPIAVVPNGVAAEFYAEPEPLPGYADGNPTVLFVGRLEPRKGLPYLVRAFLRLKPAFPRLRLLVVGRDDRNQREKAMAMVPPRLRPDVIFVGAVPQADLPSYYASADVFCAPSLGGESFGIVLVEAMAVGLPVVCSDIGGYRDILRDNQEGLLVPARDPARWPPRSARCWTTRRAAPRSARRPRRPPRATPGTWSPARSSRCTGRRSPAAAEGRRRAASGGSGGRRGPGTPKGCPGESSGVRPPEDEPRAAGRVPRRPGRYTRARGQHRPRRRQWTIQRPCGAASSARSRWRSSTRASWA